MKTAFLIVAVVCSLAFSGCATVIQSRVDVEVTPWNAKLELYGNTGKKLAETQAVDGKASFAVTGDEYALSGLTIHATAPNHHMEMVRVYIKKPGPVEITLMEYAHVGAVRRASETKARNERSREEYIAAHPDFSPEFIEVLRSGKLQVAMLWQDAHASLGTLTFVTRSEGVGGTAEVYTGTDELYRYTLYFIEGRLARWDTDTRR